MNRIETLLPGVVLLEPKVFGDHRGYLLEFYSERIFAELGIRSRFVQDNHSRSSINVLRGLHYQINHPQAKLVRVTQGTVYDVAVDVRRGSPTFGRWIGEILSADNKRMMFIPEGFAHGFYVISETAEFIYKCSDFYSPADERGVIWNDLDLKIDWPLHGRLPLLSGKDQAFGSLATRPQQDLPLYQS